jgi:hypothetical protein
MKLSPERKQVLLKWVGQVLIAWLALILLVGLLTK